jgi:hypothetical protein
MVLGLPDGIVACLFDLDGVLTNTAAVHNAAWTEMFDEYLRRRAERLGGAFVRFDPEVDYPRYVDRSCGPTACGTSWRAEASSCPRAAMRIRRMPRR